MTASPTAPTPPKRRNPKRELFHHRLGLCLLLGGAYLDQHSKQSSATPADRHGNWLLYVRLHLLVDNARRIL